MNEVFLNGILHLFAIFAAPCQTQHDRVLGLVKNYLTQNLGISDCTTYCELFEELFDLHVTLDDPESSGESAASIAENLKPELSRYDTYLLLLRVIELTRLLGEESQYQKNLFHIIAAKLAVPAEQIIALYWMVFHPDQPGMITANLLFVSSDNTSEQNYSTLNADGFEGAFVVLNIPEINTRFITAVSKDIIIGETPLSARTVEIL